MEKKKVKEGKTRVFCAGSLTSFLLNKQYFGSFCRFFKRIRHDTFSTLGMNRGSYEWHNMIQTMLEVGDKGIDGDQSEWDGRFKSGIALQLLDLFTAYYGPEYQLERKILFMHSVFPNIRVTWNFDGPSKSYIFEVPGCMPSGWYLTYVMNSLVNAVLMRLAWIELVSRPYNDLYYFHKYVREKYAGDDSLLTVADPFLKEFNGINIGNYFAEYDQIFTLSTKEDIIEYRKLRECSFLKTTTGVMYNRYVPLFNMEANLETTNWISKKVPDKEKATEDNCNDVLRNVYFYGKEKFNEIRDKILERKPGFNLVSFYSLDMAYLDYGSLPDPYGTFGFQKNSNISANTLMKSIETIQKQSNSFNFMNESALQVFLN